MGRRGIGVVQRGVWEWCRLGEQLAGQGTDERPLAAAVVAGGACCTRDNFGSRQQLQSGVVREVSRVLQGKSGSTFGSQFPGFVGQAGSMLLRDEAREILGLGGEE
jgi:hypothetical protein